ncbi:MAG TPA: hypothetical protein VFE12_14885 [Acetobacteraceae bacterium]|nr:hypothetical protein [Acetobacteraceae bacterium]
MSRRLWRRSALVAGGLVGVCAAGYGALVGWAWTRYGRPAPPSAEEADAQLDRFLPAYDVAERHAIHVDAPAAVALAAAKATDMQQSRMVRTIFRAREVVLRSTPAERPGPRGLVAETTALGWGALADIPGRELVMGAVTRPWLANVTFRAVPPDRFAAFDEPGYVKIAWTLRADPQPDGSSILRTETRVVATDEHARRKFRWYWARFSPGIVLIRLVLLPAAKADAERTYRKEGAA